MQLSGRTAVVTGANRGIGLELVRQLLAKGNTVLATARKPAAAADLQKLQQQNSERLIVSQLDVASPDSIEKWAAEVKARLPHVDLLINNAGVTDRWKGLDEVTAGDMLHCFTTNTIGPLLVTQQLRRQGLLGGRGGDTLIANVTSKMGSIDWTGGSSDAAYRQQRQERQQQRATMGSIDDNGSGSDYAYRASKCALNIVNKSLSIDLAGENITCVLLHPGYVITDMVDNQGLIDTKTSVAGLLGVLESDRELNGRWYAWDGKEIAW